MIGIDVWLLDVLGHIGYLCLALGMFLLARKVIWGWAARGTGEAIWLLIGVEIQMSSIWVWGVIFLIMEVYGYCLWKNGTQKVG